jgi:VanZ family protein
LPTARQISTTARGLLLLGAAVAAVLMLGPFQGAERYFGLTDFAAHAIAFYGLCCLWFLAGPRLRRNDVALVLIALGAAAEAAQGAVGRSMSLSDFLADAVGVFAAWAPSQIETLRQFAREHPDRPLRRRTGDRRGAAAAPATGTAQT